MMTAEDLKYSILLMAMQGKLVEQRSEEGTGEALLKKMQLDKARLLREKRIKNDKPLTKVSEDEVTFEVPRNWTVVRVGEIGSWSAGATPSRSHPEYYGGNIPWLKTGDLNDGDIINIPECITEEGVKHSSVRLNPIGTVLMAMYGATIGKLGILQIEATTNQACCACICYEGMWNKYLFYYLLSQRKNYIAMGAGGAQPNISKEKIINSVIALPPLAEQKRIVAKIEELMPFVEQYAAASTKLNKLNATFPEMMKKSILQEAVQGKLVPQDPNDEPASVLLKKIAEEKKRLIKEGKIKKQKPLPEITEDEIPFDIPENWEWARIGEIALLNPKNDLDDSLETSFIPMMLVDDKFSNHHISEKRKWGEIKKGFSHFAEGDIGVAKITPCFQNRKSCVFKNLINGYGAGTTELSIVRPLKEYCNQEYLLCIFKSEYFISNGVKSFTGTAGQQRIHKDYLKQFVMPVPPFEEQKRIVAKVKELMMLVDGFVQ